MLAAYGSHDVLQLPKVFALKRSSGELAWENSVAQQQILSSGCLAGDVFVVGSDDGVLYAFTATNGTSKWRFRAGGEFTGGATYDAASELIFVGSSARKLHVLQRNGPASFERLLRASDRLVLYSKIARPSTGMILVRLPVPD